MPSRLSISRPRTASRPPTVSSVEEKVSASSSSSSRPSVVRVGGAPVTLESSKEDNEEWEPENEEERMNIQEITEAITQWEEDLKVKGRPISGRTM